MKKVLFTATVDEHILSFHIPYLKMLKENGYEIHVATNGTAEIPYCDVKHTVSFERNPIKINNLKAIQELKKIIDKENFNIIHCHTPMGSVVTRIAAKKARKKGTRVIYTAHGFHFYKGAPLLNWCIFYPIEKHLSKYTDCLITINQEDYDLAKSKFKAKQTELVHGVGVDESKFDFEMTEEEKHNLRMSLGLKDDDFVLIEVGELNKNKNQIMAIEAMKELIKENSNIHLLIIGKGPLEKLYKDKVSEYKLQDNVHLLGQRDDVPQLMKISDVLLSLSYREGLPVNVIEGMMCGLPVIATDCRGNRDLVEEGKNGIKIEHKVDELKIAIGDIARSKNKYKISIESKEYLQKSINEKMTIIYSNILKKKILHILASNKYSGAENVVCQIIKCFNNEYNMIYCSPQGLIEQRLQKENINYIPLKKLNLVELRRILKKNNPDIIHAHDFKASIITAFCIGNYYKISHLHQSPKMIKKVTLKSLLYYFTTICYNKIIIVSKGIKDSYIFKNKNLSRTIVLNNYVDSNEIIKRAKEQEEKKTDLIFVGRLDEVKDPIEFINIVDNVKKEYNNIKAIMIGDGKLFNKCKFEVRERELNENLKLIGYKENPFPYVIKSKFLISTSKEEGFGLSIVESILLDNVVLCSNTEGAKEIFGDNYWGICKDTNEFVIKLLQLLNDNNLYNEILKKSKEIVGNYTDERKFKSELSKIYKMN